MALTWLGRYNKKPKNQSIGQRNFKDQASQVHTDLGRQNKLYSHRSCLWTQSVFVIKLLVVVKTRNEHLKLSESGLLDLLLDYTLTGEKIIEWKFNFYLMFIKCLRLMVIVRPMFRYIQEVTWKLRVVVVVVSGGVREVVAPISTVRRRLLLVLASYRLQRFLHFYQHNLHIVTLSLIYTH